VYNSSASDKAGPKAQLLAKVVRHLNIDSTRQCQLGRRIAPPVIATFELARVFCEEKKSGFGKCRSRFCS
jgi:hypothetical protein